MFAVLRRTTVQTPDGAAMTESPDRPRRSFVWLWVLFGLAVLGTPIIVVTVSLRRTPEERPLVGTWQISDMGLTITFRHDGTGTTDHTTDFRWSVRDGRLIGADDKWFQYVQHRVLGTDIGRDEYRIEEVTPNRIVLVNDAVGNPTPTVLTR